MKVTLGALWLITLAAAFGIGHYAAPKTEADALSSVASFRSALVETDPTARAHRFSAFVQGMTEDQLPEAVEAFEAGRLWLSQEELRLFLLAWARFDPAGAFARVDAWTEGSRERAQNAAVYAWGFYDPEAALEVVQGIQGRVPRTRLRHELVAGWAAGEHKWSLGDWIATLSDGQVRQRYTGTLARALLRDGAESLIEWTEAAVAESEDQDFKNTVALKAMNTLAHQHHVRAKTWIDEHMEHEYARKAAPVVARHWAKRDPEAALAWSLEIPTAEQRDRSVGYAFGPWLANDPEAAEAWLLANTPAAAADSAVRTMIGKTMPKSFERAIDWAERIEDPRKREQSITDLAHRWRRRDEEAADAWLAEAELSDEMRQKILESPQVRGGRRNPARPPHLRQRGGAAQNP